MNVRDQERQLMNRLEACIREVSYAKNELYIFRAQNKEELIKVTPEEEAALLANLGITKEDFKD